MKGTPQDNLEIASILTSLSALIPRRPLVLIAIGSLTLCVGQDQFTPKPKGTTTFYGDVLPIYERACLSCHHPGGPAPFDLGEYKSAAPRALISSYIAVRRQMPISDGTSDYDHLGSGPSLSQKDLLTIKQWADEGARKGRPRTPNYPKVPEFRFKPDEVLTLKTSARIPPDSPPIYVDIPLTVSRSLSGSYTGFSLSAANGYFCRFVALLRKSGTIATAALGYRAMDLKEPAGFHLKAGEKLIVRVRFHPTGKEQPPRVRIGLRRAKTPVLPLETVVLSQGAFTVPAGERAFKVTTEKLLEERVQIVSIVPQENCFATRLTITATSKNGQPKRLLSITEWSYLNGGAYNFSAPVVLEPGTRLRADVVFDNSASNTLNPFSPPRDVRAGDGREKPSCRVELLCKPDSEDKQDRHQPRSMIKTP